MKVLIADDDEAMRLLLREALTQWGYQVVEAGDGEEAWKTLQQQNPPQLILLDWKMPKLDGIALCQQIRRELNFYPYIIFLTQVTGSANMLKGLDAGANEFLVKPVDFKQLRSRLMSGETVLEYLKIIKEQSDKIAELEKMIVSLREKQK